MTSSISLSSTPDRLSTVATASNGKSNRSGVDENNESVATPASIQKSLSQTKLGSKSKKSGSSKLEKPTRRSLESLISASEGVFETFSASRGTFEFCGDPTSGSGCVISGSETQPLRLVGPTTVVDSLSKEGSSKKEDKWLLKANNRWGVEGTATAAKVGVWGVFDGHGGKQAATYASHAIYKYTAEFMAEGLEELGIDLSSFKIPEKDDEALQEHHPALYAPGFTRQLTKPQTLETFALQVEYMKRLPSAVHKAFLKTDEQARRQFQHGGGTTATMAFLCGWQLLVASVGDSQAFLDTGSEVLSVSSNHRLDDNGSERMRIESMGGEVASSTVNGKPAGPLRVWPGGLAMSRTIGDVDAGELCVAEAEVIQVTIPKNGARLIIGSDGLWDAVHPKTAAHHTREMAATEASHKLLSMAIKKDHLKDDVTVVVVDVFPPGCEEKVPPGLRLHSPRGGCQEPKHLARVWRPLEEVGCLRWLEEELMRRVDEYSAWRRQEEDREALVRRQKEMTKNAAKTSDASGERNKRTKKKQATLLDELSNLTLDPDAFDGWQVVGGGHSATKEEKEEMIGEKKGKPKKQAQANGHKKRLRRNRKPAVTQRTNDQDSN